MVCYRLSAIAALLHLSGKQVNAGTVDSCSQQLPCLSVEVEQDTSVRCDLDEDCSFTACITIDTGATGCARNGVGIGHLCDKSEVGGTCPNPNGHWDEQPAIRPDTAYNVQCQTGGPGEELQFVYKDGSQGCKSGDGLVDDSNDMYTVSCAPSTAEVSPLQAVAGTVRAYPSVNGKSVTIKYNRKHYMYRYTRCAVWRKAKYSGCRFMMSLVKAFQVNVSHILIDSPSSPSFANLVRHLQNVDTPQDIAESNCSNNNNPGAQCIWTVKLPDCAGKRDNLNVGTTRP